MGLTICSTSPGSMDSARELSEQAGSLLQERRAGPYLGRLAALKNKVVGDGNLDATLLAWSQGVVGERSSNN